MSKYITLFNDSTSLSYNQSNQQIIQQAIEKNQKSVEIIHGTEKHTITFTSNIPSDKQKLPKLVQIEESKSHDLPIDLSPTTIPGNIALISNVGNSCWMNSSIQLLFSIPQIRTLFENTTIDIINSFNHIIVDGNPICSEHNKNKRLLVLLKQLYDIYHISRGGIIIKHIMDPIYREIIELDMIFFLRYRYQEQDRYYKTVDAPEFMTLLIDSLACFNELTELLNLFTIDMITNKICANGTILPKNEIIRYIQVPINKQTNTLQDCIDNYMAIENIDMANQNLVGCTKIGSLLAQSKIDLNISANIRFLLIQLNRTSFDTNTNTATKINKRITPLQNISINNNYFVLQGAIIHIGLNPGGGHYIYCKFDGGGNPQYILSDSEYRLINQYYIDLLYIGGVFFYYTKL